MKIEDLPRPANYRRQMAKNGGYEMVPAYTAEEVLGIVAAQWQPIETAPKDKTVLVVSSYGHVWSAVFQYVGPRAGERWESIGLGRLPFHPTHWMSLPKAP